MKLNKILFSLLLIGIGATISFGQNERKVELADKKVEHMMYADAITLYAEADTKTGTDDIRIKIANCYIKMNDPKKVVSWYGMVEDKNGMKPIDHYNYAQALSSMGQFDEAKQWYVLYESEASDDLRAHNKVYALEHLEDYYKDSTRYDVEELTVLNSEASDFAPAFYKEGIVFPSSRVYHNGSQRTFKWDNSAFLDLYYSEKTGSSPMDYGEPVHFSNVLNTKFHEGALTFNEQGTKVIFTRNNYFHSNKSKSSEGSILVKLYSAEHSEDKHGVHGWGHVKELPFNSDEFSTGDPSANADFTVLYFVSNRPGGEGGTDIYKVTYDNEKNKWSSPQNLGPEINTSGNERFPFIHSDGTLFFSSDGRAGIGGLDIYEAKQKNGAWEVKDMGYPLNTPMDDFGLIFSKSRTYGYLTSNRVGGLGSDDIYKFTVKNIEVEVFGNIFSKLEGDEDDTKLSLEGANVVIYDMTNDEIVDSLMSDDNGNFNITLHKGSVYEFRGTKEGLLSQTKTVDYTEYDGLKNDTVNLLLIEPLPDVIHMLVEVKDKDNKTPIINSTVYLMDSETKEVTSFTTDKDGKVNLVMKPGTEYVMKGTKLKFLSDCVTFNSGKSQKGVKQLERPLYLEIFKVSQKFKIENVYFDLNKHEIRPDAAIELDKVVAFINEHPGITIELGSHTDSRGSDAYNLSLSEKRAHSSRDYIVSKNISKQTITWKGYGETNLTNDCGNGVKCTSQQHQENRRTEIKITGIKDLSPEEEAKLEANKKGLSGSDDISDCNKIEVLNN